MITIDQLLESVDLDFEPRWVTKDKNGDVCLFESRPIKGGVSWLHNNNKYVWLDSLRVANFDGKDWAECIYEVPRKTTGKIEKLCIIKDTRNVIDKDGIIHTVANFTAVEKINELIDAVNKLNGAKNE